MNKLKVEIPTKKIGTYLRDFSIVVAGIAVTLWVQSWLTSRNQKNDTGLYLKALKLEMEQNCITLDSVLILTMEKSLNYFHYISMPDKKLLNPDTIQSYYYTYYNVPYFKIMFDAFEMFKTSGNMRFITDKEMMLSIWSIYNDMHRYENWIDRYYRDKERRNKKRFSINR